MKPKQLGLPFSGGGFSWSDGFESVRMFAAGIAKVYGEARRGRPKCMARSKRGRQCRRYGRTTVDGEPRCAVHAPPVAVAAAADAPVQKPLF